MPDLVSFVGYFAIAIAITIGWFRASRYWRIQTENLRRQHIIDERAAKAEGELFDRIVKRLRFWK